MHNIFEVFHSNIKSLLTVIVSVLHEAQFFSLFYLFESSGDLEGPPVRPVC